MGHATFLSKWMWFLLFSGNYSCQISHSWRKRRCKNTSTILKIRHWEGDHPKKRSENLTHFYLINQLFFLVVIGDRWLYATYHLFREPRNSIEYKVQYPICSGISELQCLQKKAANLPEFLFREWHFIEVPNYILMKLLLEKTAQLLSYPPSPRNYLEDFFPGLSRIRG